MGRQKELGIMFEVFDYRTGATLLVTDELALAQDACTALPFSDYEQVAA